MAGAMARTMTQTLARHVFDSRTEPLTYQSKRGIKRPAEPEMILRLQAPTKRQCIRELYVPSQADDLREQTQLVEEARLEKFIRAQALVLADARLAPGGSGHPLIKTVHLEPVEQPLPKGCRPYTGKADEGQEIDDYNTQLMATKHAANKLDGLNKSDYRYYGELPSGFEKNWSQGDLIRKKPDSITPKDLESGAVGRKSTMAEKVAVKERAEAERMRLLTTRKSGREYGVFARSIMIDQMQHLPQLKRIQGNLKELVTGEVKLIEFRGTDESHGLHPTDHFRIPVCKRVLNVNNARPQPISFFRKEFKELHEVVAGSVNKYYGGQLSLNGDDAMEVISELFGTVKLSSLITAVYDSDGNCTNVVVNPKRRTELVQAIIVRMLHVRVFSPLLFGGSRKQCEDIAHEERRLATDNRLEGFARQKRRSAFIKDELRYPNPTPNGLPEFFDTKVDHVALEIFNLLSPIADKLRALGPGRQPETCQELREDDFKEQAAAYTNGCRESHFVAVHNVVSMAAYLAISIRIHPTPIMVDLRTPGIKWEKELELKVTNFDEYKETKTQLVEEHMYRKDRERAAIENDIAEAKRVAGTHFDSAIVRYQKESFLKDREYLFHAFNYYDKASFRPSGPEAWRRILQDGLECPDPHDKFTAEQRKRGKIYLSWLRLRDLIVKLNIKFNDFDRSEGKLRKAYIEQYCGHYMEDNRWRYNPDDDITNRKPLIRCALWPSIKLYQPGNGAPGGENNGMRSWTITKGEAACHFAVPKDEVRTDYLDRMLLDAAKMATEDVGEMNQEERNAYFHPINSGWRYKVLDTTDDNNAGSPEYPAVNLYSLSNWSTAQRNYRRYRYGKQQARSAQAERKATRMNNRRKFAKGVVENRVMEERRKGQRNAEAHEAELAKSKQAKAAKAAAAAAKKAAAEASKPKAAKPKPGKFKMNEIPPETWDTWTPEMKMKQRHTASATAMQEIIKRIEAKVIEVTPESIAEEVSMSNDWFGLV